MYCQSMTPNTMLIARISSSHHLRHTHPTLCPLAVCTLNGLSSAALAGSSENKVLKYSPMNLTIAFGSPLPCENAAGLAYKAPKSTEGALNDLLLEPDGASDEPNDCPLPLKDAEDLAGPFAALAAAERMAVRRAVGFAPRTVSTTVVPLRTRKVGILVCEISVSTVGSMAACSTYAEMPYVLATSFWLSTFTLQNVIRPGLLSAAASCSKIGLICLHGPHYQVVSGPFS